MVLFFGRFNLPLRTALSLSFFLFAHSLSNSRIDINALGQVKRVLRALARALLRSESSVMSPPTMSETAHGGDAADASAPKKTTAGSKAGEEACAAAERSISALEEFLAKEGEKGGDEAAAAAAAAAAEARSRLALSLSFAPLADALLSLVAPDWLRDFTEEESRELFDAFFLDGGAAAAEVLEACCDHLGSVQPIPSEGPDGNGAASFLPFGPSFGGGRSPSSAMAAAPGAHAAAADVKPCDMAFSGGDV